MGISHQHLPQKPPTNPTHPSYLTPGMFPNPFHHVNTDEYVRFVGYNWSFYPRGKPLSTPNSANYLPANSEGPPYRPGLARSKPCPLGETSTSSR